jgi:hypothetical protein
MICCYKSPYTPPFLKGGKADIRGSPDTRRKRPTKGFGILHPDDVSRQMFVRRIDIGVEKTADNGLNVLGFELP